MATATFRRKRARPIRWMGEATKRALNPSSVCSEARSSLSKGAEVSSGGGAVGLRKVAGWLSGQDQRFQGQTCLLGVCFRPMGPGSGTSRCGCV